MSFIKAIFSMFKQLTIAPRAVFISEPENFKKYSPEAQRIKMQKALIKRERRKQRGW